jgi:predicted small secreted protein
MQTVGNIMVTVDMVGVGKDIMVTVDMVGVGKDIVVVGEDIMVDMDVNYITLILHTHNIL